MKLNTQVHNKKSLKEIRKQLRNNSTPAESELWKYLKNRKLGGKKFRRQHSIGNFIVDFNCPEIRIIVELDGEVHNDSEQKQKDKDRDETLGDMGYKILRFTNREVLSDIQKVLDEIERNFPPTLFKDGDRRGNFLPPPYSRRGAGGVVMLLCLVLLYSECNSAKKGQLSGAKDNIGHPEVIIDNTSGPGNEKPTYKIESASIADSILSLNISYTGGCKEHFFELVSNGLYAKSLPPQTTVWLRHENNGDSCEKIIEKTVTYDISKLKYPGQHTLLIKIITFKDKIAYNY